MIVIKTGQLSLPIYWSSRKQTSVARSTPEAELIAMSSAMFTEVINVQTMLQQLLERPIQVNYRQDNQAVVDIVTSGYSAKLRHAPRVHRVNVSSVNEVLSEGFLQFNLVCPYCRADCKRLGQSHFSSRVAINASAIVHPRL